MKAENKCVNVDNVCTFIQYTGDNLLEVLEFTGRHPEFDSWFYSDEEYVKYVKDNGNVFKLFRPHPLGNRYDEVNVGDYIIDILAYKLVVTEQQFNKRCIVL
ncbi:MAG: hypothetical protein CMK07_13465 [Ponticaulis sp.]|nr:hypothetical protein [Ponticaulis sp.]|tara:strand:- start:4250 stop:4555 length:306 start_codon:yes stop_codon:yes gene_type:complete